MLSALYVPLVKLGGDTTAVIRLMASLWAVGAALLVGGLVRELIGRGGVAVGAAATLALPPAWVVFSTTAKGNHVEGTVLSLACCWLLARLPGRSGPASAIALGAVCGFSAWFADIALGPAVLAFALGCFGPRRGWVVLGALLAVPLLLGLPAASGADGISVGVADILGALWDRPTRLPALIALSYVDVPVFDTLLMRPETHLGAGWLGLQRAICVVNWVAVAAAMALLRRQDPSKLIAVLPLLVPALLLPLAFSVVGMGPESLGELGLPRAYFWEPRRLVLVYPLWAVSWAVLFGVPGASMARRWTVSVWTVGSLALVLSFLLPGEAGPAGFQPQRYMLCPAQTPAHELDTCVPRLRPGEAESLERLLGHAVFVDHRAVRAGLEGWRSVEGDGTACRLVDLHLSEAFTRELLGFWLGVGHAAGLRCPTDAATAACSGAPSPALHAACADAASTAAPAAAPHESGRLPPPR